GNTGAVMAAALFTLGRVKGVKRPGLAAVVPRDVQPLLVIDVGANTDCKPEYLQQFALMGSIYAEKVLGISRPRVALLANGEEETKGNQLVQETHALLKGMTALNFVGNIEGKDVLHQLADVVVCDGFDGNILLKTAEGVAAMMRDVIRQEIKRSPLTAIGGLLAKPAFDRVSARLDYAEVGGAPLLGVDGVVIIGHGRSTPKAVKNMIRAAMRAVEADVLGAIQQVAELETNQ
ncbi:MAG: phosphate acyltransferase PlsX, partial [Chloroflexi bacterium]|nr:phosphate acyltransferase PlsX [Chloroflexota bacterium]